MKYLIILLLMMLPACMHVKPAIKVRLKCELMEKTSFDKYGQEGKCGVVTEMNVLEIK